MNWLDIVIALLGLYALWEGWRQGLVVQVLGLVAVLAGLAVAWYHGRSIGHWLGISQEGLATAAGFVVVLIVVVLAVVLLGRLTRGLFRVAGLGVFDNILGGVFSLLKMCAFIGLAMMLSDALDPRGRFISESTRDGSALFRIVDGINGAVFPFVEGLFK